jgi:hypothetical protein
MDLSSPLPRTTRNRSNMPATRNPPHIPFYLRMTPTEYNQRGPRPRPYHDSLDEARKHAERLLPGVKLDYILKRERDVRNWIDDKEYLDPKLGSLFWCHKGAPKTKSAMATTRMYVIEDLVGATVDAVAKAAKERSKRKAPPQEGAWNWKVEQEVHQRVAAMLKQEREKVPSGFWGPVEHVTADQVYTMIADREFGRKDFEHWVDIQPWIAPAHRKLEELSNDLQSMVVEPVAAAVGEQGMNPAAGVTNPNAITVEEWEYWEQNKDPEIRAVELEEAIMSKLTPLLV